MTDPHKAMGRALADARAALTADTSVTRHDPVPPYPGEFYVAHRLFTGPGFPPGGTWGDVLDGPMDDGDDMIRAVAEAFKGEALPTRATLRVWHIGMGSACNVTGTVSAIVAELRGLE